MGVVFIKRKLYNGIRRAIYMRNNKYLKTLTMIGAAMFSVVSVGAGAGALGAVEEHTDNIELTVGATCTLGTITDGAYNEDTDVSHASGNYVNINNDEVGGAWSGDTLAVTMSPGTVSENIGQTTLTVRCNNAAGYEIIGMAGDGESNMGPLKKIGSDAVILNAAGFGEAPNNTVATGASYWNMRAESDDMTIAADYLTANGLAGDVAVKIAGKASSGNIDDGESITITYGAGINLYQESGMYEGSATYTLIQLDAPVNDTDMANNAEPEPAVDPEQQNVVEEPGGETETEGNDPVEGNSVEPVNKNEDGDPVTPVVEPESEQQNNVSQRVAAPAFTNTLSMVPPTTINNTYNYISQGGQGQGTDEPVQIASSEKSNGDEYTGAKGVSSNNGAQAAKTIAAVSPEPESNNSGIIVAMCAAGVAATAGAGAYLYNKGKEEE